MNLIYTSVKIDKYTIMPNHLHLIIVIDFQGEEGQSQPITDGIWPQTIPTIARVIQQFKGIITKKVGVSLWQGRYYDHIIRDEKEYQKIWEYIDTNPLKWELDKYFSG